MKNSNYSLFYRSTLAAIGGFLDAFQKVADMATGSRGKFNQGWYEKMLKGYYSYNYEQIFAN